VDALQRKDITALALGRAAGNKNKLSSTLPPSAGGGGKGSPSSPGGKKKKEPVVEFCTPEYLFCAPSATGYLGTAGQLVHCTLLSKQEHFNVITI